MFEELNEVESRFQQLNVRLCDPAVVADTALYTKLMKEYSTLSPLIEAYRAYCAAQKDEEEAQALLEEGGDRELHELALGQLHEAQKQKSALTETLQNPAFAERPERRQKRDLRNPRRRGRRRGGAVLRRAFAHVPDVLRCARMEKRNF